MLLPLDIFSSCAAVFHFNISTTFAVMWIDKGYQRGALHLVCRLITMIGTIVYYSLSERAYFSLFNEIYIILIGQH